MSDMKLYKILENFDNLESATDKLTPVEEASPEARKGELNTRENRALVRDIQQHFPGDDKNEIWNWLVSAADYDEPLTAEEYADYRKFGEDGLEEDQTKVQTMGDKVRVTKDGDTTEFDDAETAKAMMGDDEDENTFATESKDELYSECPRCHKDILSTELKKHREEVHGDEIATADDIAEDATEELAEADWIGEFDSAGADDFETPPGVADEDGAEFSTFDADNTAHRRRLQRGTPVVLSPEVCSDPEGNRRGVFVNRSPSGHFGTVIRDCDGKTVNVHLSDIVSADIVNNSIYEEFNLDFEAMLAEDLTITQTTNPDAPENDTTTVTAVGQDAVDDLAAIMANAGMTSTDYEPVDQGEPAAEPAPAPDMANMIDIVDGPEGELDAPEELAASANCGMDEEAVEEAKYEMEYSPITKESPCWDCGSIYDGHHTPSCAMAEPTDKRDLPEEPGTQYWTGEVPAHLQGRDEAVEEERDIAHANTPDEMVAGVDVVTHGIAGGLNAPKQQYRKEYPGDNPKTVYAEYGLDENWEDAEDDFDEDEFLEPLNPNYEPSDADLDAIEAEDEFAMEDEADIKAKAQAMKKADQDKMRVDRDMSTRSSPSRLRDRGRGTGQADRSVNFRLGETDEPVEDVVEDETFVNEHENVDSFLSLYKEFSNRGEKKS